MDNDVPALIEQCRARCAQLDESVLKSAHAVESLSGLAGTISARLEAIDQRGQSTVSIAQKSLENVDALLDRLLHDIQQHTETTGAQAQAASAATGQSLAALASGLATLGAQAGQTVVENHQHHQFQQSETDTLQGFLGTLMASMDGATEGAIRHAANVQQQIEAKHGGVGFAAQALQQGFAAFQTGVNSHHHNLQGELNTAHVKTQKQLEDFQLELQRQLKAASGRVEQMLQQTSKGLHNNADGVERFLDEVLTFLEGSKDLLKNHLTPPVKTINQALDALQPVINLLGTLKSIGIIS